MDIWIHGACRTPIGKMGGLLAGVSAIDLGTVVISDALRRTGISAESVDHVIMGCVLQAGLGQNPARQAAIRAGIPFTATAETINMVCGSGLRAVCEAADMIRLGEADVVVAGGMESMSQAPFALANARFGYRMGSPMINTPVIDTMVSDSLWDAFNNYHMGITAENVAEQWHLSREELDGFAVMSQQKACRAWTDGLFRDEIVPVTIENKKGNLLIDRDEAPRPDVTPESLAKLKPAFKKDGLVTAGNSSGINDGAAAIVLLSEKKGRELGLFPQAVWAGGSMAGVDPKLMGIGPVASTKKLLDKMHMTMDDVDLIEANEAFASQSIAVQRELGIPDEKLNISGGAIALGHPVGASGCRILVTLIHNLLRRGAAAGLATLCVGGGMGCSALVRRE